MRRAARIRVGAAILAGGVAWAQGVAAPAASPGSGVRVIADVSYLTPDRAEKLDLYLPAGRPPVARSPAVVVIHGSGWVSGDKHGRRERDMAADLAQAGYVCAAIDYRLGAAAWPTNLCDCKNAVRFLRARAAEYGVDPEHIAVMGGSAGGHLALMVGFTTDEPGLEPAAPYPGVSSRVTAVGDFYGPADLVPPLDQHGHPLATRYEESAVKVFGIAPAAAAPLWRAVSPLGHVKDSSPPVLILQGRADTSVDYEQSLRLARELERHGVPHQLVILDGGVGHGFDFQSTIQGQPLPQDLRPVVFGFLARYMPIHYQADSADNRSP